MKYLSFGLIILVFSLGCGGTNGGGVGGCCGVPGINVKVVSPIGAGSVDDNPTLNLPITVKVTNDSANAGVIWTLAPAVKGDPAGTLSGQQALAVTYNPPTAVTSPLQVTITATSVTDPTRSAIIPVTVYPPLAGITTPATALTTAFLNTNYTCFQVSTFFVSQNTCLAAVSGGMEPYSWSLGQSLLPPGLQLGAAGQTLPPGTTSATAIVGIPTAVGIYPFSLTVTDGTGNTATLPLNINVAPAQLKVPTPTVMNVLPGLPYAPTQLQVSGGVPPYTWSLAPGSSPLPSWVGLSAGGVLSANPPANLSGPYSFAVQVMDSQTPVPAQAVFPAPSPSQPSTGGLILLATEPFDESHFPCQSGSFHSLQPSTPYAFVFSGFDKDGPVTFSASFTADSNGNLTGVEDIIRSGVPVQLAQPLLAGSSMLFAANTGAGQPDRGCLTLSTASSTNTVFRVTPNAAISSGPNLYFTDGRIVEFDDTDGTGTRGVGSFHMQDSTVFATPVAGPFAFRFSGWDASANHFAMAGTATAATGSLTSVSADVNDGGTLSGPLAGGGTIGAADTTGRGLATLSAGTTNYDLIYYIVDANHLVFNSAQAVSSGHPLITGEAITSAGPFSQATLSNSHIYRFGGALPGSPDVAVGVLHFDGLGAVGGTNYERSGGAPSATTVSAQYSVDPSTGRFTFAGTGVPVVGYAVPSTGGITGYLVGTGASAASGTMEFQTSSYPPGYKFAPISGTYGLGTEEMLDPQATLTLGSEQTNGLSLNLSDPTAYLDSSGIAGLTPFQEFGLFKYTWSADGSGTWGGNTYMVTSCVNPKFFYIDTSPLNAHPSVVVGQCFGTTCPTTKTCQ